MGILAICHDADPANDMSRAEIVRAIAHIESATVAIEGASPVLNAWRW